MNKLKQIVRLLKLFLIAIFLFSCSEDEILNSSNSIEENTNFINSIAIENIIKDIKHPKKNGTLESKRMISKTIKKIDKIPDENGNTCFYVINYKEGGFLLLSSDNRIEPVLAYSDDGYFPIDNSRK